MLDHLVYATPNLDMTVATLHTDWGVLAVPGGRHPGLGTHNALIGLGRGAYLEVVGPDPGQPAPSGPRRFGIDGLHAPRLVTWAAKAPAIERAVVDAKALGHDPGPIFPLSRSLPDGTLLEWRLTSLPLAGNGLVPFLIDWGSSEHPSETAATGVTLLDMWGEHPDPASVTPLLDALRLSLPVRPSQVPALAAVLDTPAGRKELR